MFGENSGGLICDLRIFAFWVYIIRFSWKLEDEESGVKTKKNVIYQTPNRLRLQNQVLTFLQHFEIQLLYR